MDNQYNPNYPAPQKTNTSAIVAFILGLVSIVFAWWAYVGIIGVVAGIISIIFFVKANKEIQATRQGGQGLAIAGLVLGIIGLIGGLITFVCTIACISAASSIEKQLEDQFKDWENTLKSFSIKG